MYTTVYIHIQVNAKNIRVYKESQSLLSSFILSLFILVFNYCHLSDLNKCHLNTLNITCLAKMLYNYLLANQGDG